MNVHVTFTPQDQTDSPGRHVTAKILHVFLKISVRKPRHATLQLIAVIL